MFNATNRDGLMSLEGGRDPTVAISGSKDEKGVNKKISPATTSIIIVVVTALILLLSWVVSRCKKSKAGVLHDREGAQAARERIAAQQYHLDEGWCLNEKGFENLCARAHCVRVAILTIWCLVQDKRAHSCPCAL